MAKLDHIDQRLKRWGAWRSRKQDSGLGYPKRSVLLAIGGGGHSGYRDAVIIIDDTEAAQTDRAVESLRYTSSALYLTLMCIYVHNLGVTATAQKMQQATSSVKHRIGTAHVAIDRWLAAAKQATK